VRETKLFQVLHQVPEDQRKQFALYVASPYFNSVPRLAKLLEVLEQHLLRYKVRELSEQEAFALLLPGQPYDQNRFRKDSSALLKLLLQFLAQSQFDAATHLHGTYLLKSLNTLGIEQHFPSYHQQALGELDASEALAAALHDSHVQLGMERYLFDLQQPSRSSDIDLDGLIDHLEIAGVIRKMELLYLQVNNRLVTSKGKKRDDAAFIQLVAEQLPFLPSQTQMYFHLYRCTLYPDLEAEYAHFKQLLSEAKLAPLQLDAMYTAALNYCARRLNSGHPRFLRETFEIYQEMLERQIFGTGGKLLSSHFKNIVLVAGRLSEFEWALQFVEQNVAHLQAEFNHNAYNFSMGVIAFHQRQFEKAERHLYRVLDDYEDIFFGVDARVILLRIHYETENMVGLESLADSFRMFIKRTTQLDGHRKANLQAFIRYLRRLARIPAFDKLALQKLKEAILAGRKFANTAWLLEKVEQNLQN
jgi:hypothetical protein